MCIVNKLQFVNELVYEPSAPIKISQKLLCVRQRSGLLDTSGVPICSDLGVLSPPIARRRHRSGGVFIDAPLPTDYSHGTTLHTNGNPEGYG
jgi:hypothetical protein